MVPILPLCSGLVRIATLLASAPCLVVDEEAAAGM